MTQLEISKSPWLLGFPALFGNGSAPFVFFTLERREHEIEGDQQFDSNRVVHSRQPPSLRAEREYGGPISGRHRTAASIAGW